MSRHFDVAVIGAGPGGYVAAIRCAQLGLSAACIDEWKSADGKPSLGGTCLNVGCIPSKALLESSENYERAISHFGAHGIRIEGVSMDVAQMMARKEGIVRQLTGGIEMLFKKNKVTLLHGHGRFVAGGASYQLEVVDGGAAETITATHVIVATGSVPRQLPGAPVDGRLILDNAGALSLQEVPQRLGVVGAGVIGLEMGSVWRRLGSEVTVLEAMDSFLAAADEQVAKEAQRIFTNDVGLQIHTGVKITAVKAAKKQVTVEYETGAGAQKAVFDRLIVAIGRAANTTGLGAEKVGLKLDGSGRVEVDELCRTNLNNVYAVGDVVRGPMLAHKSSEEGVAVAETIAGHPASVNLDAVPWVIYTAPEIAWVGRTEQALKAAGVEYKRGVFRFAANGRALGIGDSRGFVKVLADVRSDRILGVHIVGPFASELIGEAVVAMEFHASSEDIARIVHAHPSLSEVLHEAALACDKRAIHG